MRPKLKRVPVKPEHTALYNEATIMSQFPITFPNGNTLDAWHGDCIDCGKKIDAALLHGTITSPMDSVVVIKAVGVCSDCRLLTPFHCRIREDLSMEFINHEGRWCRTDDHGTYYLDVNPPNEPCIWSFVKALINSWGVFLILMLPMVLCLLNVLRK